MAQELVEELDQLRNRVYTLERFMQRWESDWRTMQKNIMSAYETRVKVIRDLMKTEEISQGCKDFLEDLLQQEEKLCFHAAAPTI